MGEEISKEIVVDGVDPRELYGAQDVYLEQIRALHPALRIVARGIVAQGAGRPKRGRTFRTPHAGIDRLLP